MLTDIVNDINSDIVQAFSRFSSWKPNERITDYAKPLVTIISLYNPALFTIDNNKILQRQLREIYNFLFIESFIIKRYIDSNWHAYRLWVMSVIAYKLSMSNQISILRNAVTDFIHDNLDSNGAFSDFYARDSVSYHAYCLDAVVNAMIVLSNDLWKITVVNNVIKYEEIAKLSTDWWEIIMPAFRFLHIYMKKTHIEFKNSRLESDKNQPMYNKPFDPKSVIYVVRSAINNIQGFGSWWTSLQV